MTLYDCRYNPVGETPAFKTVEQAAKWAMTFLPNDDFAYMIGTDGGIVAFVFQGKIYR